MEFVNQLKNELAKAGATRVAFAVVPKKPEYDIRFYKDFSFQTRIPNYILANHRPQAFYKAISHFQNPIHIKLNISGKCTINNKPVEDGNIKPTLRALLKIDISLFLYSMFFQ
jgi:biopolymer transport protein ExbD